MMAKKNKSQKIEGWSYYKATNGAKFFKWRWRDNRDFECRIIDLLTPRSRRPKIFFGLIFALGLGFLFYPHLPPARQPEDAPPAAIFFMIGMVIVGQIISFSISRLLRHQEKIRLNQNHVWLAGKRFKRDQFTDQFTARTGRLRRGGRDFEFYFIYAGLEKGGIETIFKASNVPLNEEFVVNILNVLNAAVAKTLPLGLDAGGLEEEPAPRAAKDDGGDLI